MEQKNIISLICGILLGVIVAYLGLFCLFLFSLSRNVRPKEEIKYVRLQRVELDAYTQSNSIVYLLQPITKDTTVRTKTDVTNAESITVKDKGGKDITTTFHFLNKVNGREFDNVSLKSPLLGRNIRVSSTKYQTTMKEFDWYDFRNNQLLIFPKGNTLPAYVEIQFEECTLKGEINNVPVNYFIMSIDYDELPPQAK